MVVTLNEEIETPMEKLDGESRIFDPRDIRQSIFEWIKLKV